jgi:hypothetical protein
VATFSHVGLTAACRSCHNGITATGKQIRHENTTLDCGACHNTLSWTLLRAPAPLPHSAPSPRAPNGGPVK